jgi:aryl-alcohol dehydrogenase-like predicted oxidoreductase
MPEAAALFDDFFERGGDFFDTAHIDGAGLSERLLGRWLASRGVRDLVVPLGQGAHTACCEPSFIGPQLEASLERLGTDHVDLYLLHRDNRQVPAGEFVDALCALRRAGRLAAFGGSNWSTRRVDDANAWARAHDLPGFAAVGNSFSLARMVDPPRSGCLGASEPEDRRWFEARQMTLVAWSSPARDFFVGADPADPHDGALVRCWCSDANSRRLQRARELAEKLGVSALNIALAYILCQAFPTVALIGPRALSETRTAWAALDVKLDAQQVAWLDLRDEAG